MRLFFQLNEAEKVSACENCVGMVLNDLIDGNFKPEDAFAGEDNETKKLFNTAIEDINKMEDRDEKFDFLLGNDMLMDVVWGIANEMVKTFYFLDAGESSMYPEEYAAHECENCKHEREESETAETATTNQNESPTTNIIYHKKHKHNIN